MGMRKVTDIYIECFLGAIVGLAVAAVVIITLACALFASFHVFE